MSPETATIVAAVVPSIVTLILGIIGFFKLAQIHVLVNSNMSALRAELATSREVNKVLTNAADSTAK